MAAEKKRQNESPVEELSSAPRLKKAKKKLDLELGDMPTFIFDAEAGMEECKSMQTPFSFDFAFSAFLTFQSPF